MEKGLFEDKPTSKGMTGIFSHRNSGEGGGGGGGGGGLMTYSLGKLSQLRNLTNKVVMSTSGQFTLQLTAEMAHLILVLISHLFKHVTGL